jgi:hypothetical protein
MIRQAERTRASDPKVDCTFEIDPMLPSLVGASFFAENLGHFSLARTSGSAQCACGVDSSLPTFIPVDGGRGDGVSRTVGPKSLIAATNFRASSPGMKRE